MDERTTVARGRVARGFAVHLVPRLSRGSSTGEARGYFQEQGWPEDGPHVVGRGGGSVGGGTQLGEEAGLVYSRGFSGHTGVILRLDSYGEEGGDGV